MSKNYTAKELEQLLRDILSNGYSHMESIIKELKKIESLNVDKLSPEYNNRVRHLTMIMTLLNDVVHPAHKISYRYFKGYEPMLDVYVKNQAWAFENKLVQDCFGLCCDPDGEKAYAKSQELKEKPVKEVHE